MWDMTHSYLTWLIHMGHDSLTPDMIHSCVTWLVHIFIRDITHWYMTWLIHIWHDSFKYYVCIGAGATSRRNEPCHIGMGHVKYECVTSRLDEACHIYKRVMSHIYKWVMSHYTNESCHTYTDESCHTRVISHIYKWVMSHTYKRVTCHIRISADARVVHRCWFRVAKNHRIPYLSRSFSAKEPYY